MNIFLFETYVTPSKTICIFDNFWCIHSKLQNLVRFDDIKKDQGNFQAFIFNNLWDIHVQTCSMFQTKGLKVPLMDQLKKIFMFWHTIFMQLGDGQAESLVNLTWNDPSEKCKLQCMLHLCFNSDLLTQFCTLLFLH